MNWQDHPTKSWEVKCDAIAPHPGGEASLRDKETGISSDRVGFSEAGVEPFYASLSRGAKSFSSLSLTVLTLHILTSVCIFFITFFLRFLSELLTWRIYLLFKSFFSW